MWHMSVPWWELMLRPFVVYLVLLVLLRLTGKRQVGQLSPFDLVLLLVLSNSVQNSLGGGDESLIGGLIAATTLVALNYLVGYLTYRSRTVEALAEGRPQVLIQRGKLLEDVRRGAHLSGFELEAALRQHGCERVEEVRCAVIETNGAITVIPYDAKPGDGGDSLKPAH